MKRIILIAFVVLPALAMAGCSTFQGMGQDISDSWHSVTGD